MYANFDLDLSQYHSSNVSGKKGDLIIRFKVSYPNKLTGAQKKAIKEALDPSKQTGKSAYDRIPPVTFTTTERCTCPDEKLPSGDADLAGITPLVGPEGKMANVELC